MFLFKNRVDAGMQLAELINHDLKTGFTKFSVVVYALPRGGLPVAKVISSKLEVPISVIVSKKISLPDNPEFAIGAITADGDILWNDYIDFIPPNILAQAKQVAERKARQQWELFAPLCPKINCQGAIAIVVDDGIATGMTIMAAALSLKKYHPQAIWLAAPVAPPQIGKKLQQWGDRVIIIKTPDPFFNVGRFYEDFPQLSTPEALNILQLTMDS
jgi:putative phosphoribosyl transferase